MNMDGMINHKLHVHAYNWKKGTKPAFRWRTIEIVINIIYKLL